MQVVFYKGRARLFNRACSWWLASPYSHCELVVGTDQDGYSHCVSSSFMDDGVRAKKIRLDPEHWDLVDVPFVVDEQYVRDWLRLHDDDKYDTFGLLSAFWRRNAGDRNKRICSGCVAELLGYPEPWRFDPALLFSTLTRKSQ